MERPNDMPDAPDGIIEQKVEETKREEDQIYDTITPWLRHDSEDGEAVPETHDPQGAQGAQGTQGMQGMQGVQGVQGVQGAQGTHGHGRHLLGLRSLNPLSLFKPGHSRRHASASQDDEKRRSSFWRDRDRHKRFGSTSVKPSTPVRSTEDKSTSPSTSPRTRAPPLPGSLPASAHAMHGTPSQAGAAPLIPGASRRGLLFEPLYQAAAPDAPADAQGHGVKLDTNFDNMDDIVDTSRSARSSGESSRNSTPQCSPHTRKASLPGHMTPIVQPDAHDARELSFSSSSSPVLKPDAGPSVAREARSSWTAPDSWAILSRGGGAAEDADDEDAFGAVGAVGAVGGVPRMSTSTTESDSAYSQIMIYEPVADAHTPPAAPRANPFDDVTEHRKTRFFRRASASPAREAGEQGEGKSSHGSARRPRVGHMLFLRAARHVAPSALDSVAPAVPSGPPAPLVYRATDVDPAAATGKTFVRVYMQNDTYVLISCAVETTTAEMAYALGRHAAVPDPQGHHLFLYERGTNRPLGPAERPARIFRRRLLQAGYTEADRLDELGKQDLSFLLRFVYRTDRAATVNMSDFEHQEETYKHMNLQGMHLTMLPVPMYRYAQWIVSLDLSRNPLTDLPLDFVQLCTSLRMLRMTDLAFKRVPEGVTSITHLTHLDVSSNRLQDLDHIALHTLPALKVLRATNNRLTCAPSYVPEMHALQYLNLSNNRIDTFPQRICAIPHLRDLDLSFNTISVIPSEIDRLVHLERLVLVGNSISRLPAEMQSLAALRVLDVRHTSLQSLGELVCLPHLERVLASHNYLTHLEGNVGRALGTLDLAHNPLTRVNLSAPQSSSLTHLDLSHANLVTINESLFRSVPQLRCLILDHNQFGSLPPLGSLGQLEYLSCATNALAELPQSIGSLAALKHLDVRDNNLRTLPSSIWQCKSLYSLNVSSNVLSTLPLPEALPTPRRNSDGSLASTAQSKEAPPLAYSLVNISVADNRLSDDVFAVLMHLHELEVINVSINEIYEVPSGALVALPELRELYISSNCLSALPAEDFEHLEHLRILFINGNKLQSLPAELGRLKQLRSIDAGNNALKYNIANWHYDWNWNANPELRYLNLSGNQRFEIKPKLAEVHGREKNLADFNRLRHLRMLGLMEVTMTHQPLPDESDHRRVRTTNAHVDAMPYGIADAIGSQDTLSVFDLVVPSFRGAENESLFGLIEGHSHSSVAGTRIARYMNDHAPHVLDEELKRVPSQPSMYDPVPMALRRAFLRLNQQYAEHVLRVHTEHTEHAASHSAQAPACTSAHDAYTSQEVFWGWGSRSSPDMHLWQSSATAILVYQRQHTLYVANIGHALAVLSRANGMVRVLGKKHDPLDWDEAQRIRAAEGWVSLQNRVNDKTDVARAFGQFQLTPVITACPSVLSIQLNDADEFVIIANTELWKHVSYQMAVDIARMDRNDPRIASQKLRDIAIAYGAKGPISVMVITVAGLFHEHLSAHATQRGIIESTKKMIRRGRNDTDSTLARLDREVLPPIGQVALVFTDIKNSTLLWETNPSMQSAIRLHNLLLRRQMRTIGGYEVKTEGDAFMVSFPTVASALLWCFTVQVRLLSINWPQEILDTPSTPTVYADDGTLLYRGLSVRMGVHWGCPVCEVDPVNNRMDYFGPMVNRAARISAAADGGQILVSRDVVQELERVLERHKEDEHVPHIVASEAGSQNTTPRDVVFIRRLGLGVISVGQRRLKGIEVPEHLSLVYPKMLAGRHTHLPGARRSSGLFQQMYEPTKELLSLDQIKQLGYLCLRLESLSNQRCFPGIDPKDPWSDPIYAGLRKPAGPVPRSHRNGLVQECVERAPEILIIATREDATDAELFPLLRQIITRIRNSIYTIAMHAAKNAESAHTAQHIFNALLQGLDV